jgi:MYXO-CTERM domain-containing protein
MPDPLHALLDPKNPPPVIEVAPGNRKSVPAVPANKQGAIRYAVTRDVQENLVDKAQWQALPDGRQVGFVRVLAPTATNLSLSFSRAMLPEGTRMWLEAADGTHILDRPLTEQHATGEALYTPLVTADEMVIAIERPAGAPLPVLDLVGVHVGVRHFGQLPPPPQGSCNIDVVCPESTGWEAEVDSVAVFGMSGDLWCTGFMVNNTAEDQTPLFATAQHCGLDNRNDSSLVVYWNYESANCGDLSGGQLDDWQLGSDYRMEYRDSDWTLVELDDAPDPDFEVAFAGWDRSGNTTSGAATIHHPGTDEKAISFEYDATTVTDDYSDRSDSNGSHIRVDDWDVGTTEGGSSGSPLFDTDHRVIGTLTGGYASCRRAEPDWYGRLYKAWSGDGSSSSRLSDWLDPIGSGQTTVDTLAPHMSGMGVTPTDNLDADGPVGGPFAPTSATWTLTNREEMPRSVTITTDVSWAAADAAEVSLSSSGTAEATVSITDAANALGAGRYEGTITFTSDDGSEPSTRSVSILVGEPVVFYEWDLDTDPGWTGDGAWAWGEPLGDGGQYGGPDPTAGATGDRVYGYNLAGDYQDRMRARYLTTDALDLTNALGTVLRFQRWLGVEEPEYDNASIEVSADDGRSWETVWANEDEVTDRSWQRQEVDIGAVVDGSANARVRWVMGSTDEDYTYCGWNIDDIEVLAIGEPPVIEEPTDTGTPTDSGDTGSSTVEPDPNDTAEPVDPIGTDSADPVLAETPGKGAVTGCACSASSSSRSAGWLVAGLAVLASVRRRRD